MIVRDFGSKMFNDWQCPSLPALHLEHVKHQQPVKNGEHVENIRRKTENSNILTILIEAFLQENVHEVSVVQTCSKSLKKKKSCCDLSWAWQDDGEIQNWRQPVSQQEKEKMLLLSLMCLSFVYLSAINPSQNWLSSSRGPEVNVQRLGLCSSHFDH